MKNKNGEALLHSDATPKTNNFGDKITEKSAEIQVSPAFDMLMKSVENPTDPSPVTSGMLSVIPLNDMMNVVSRLDPPNPLIKGLWNEYELAVLFGISNSGKSILATQWANEIASSGKRVIYADFELSPAQFFQRYSNDSREGFAFSPNLYRVELDTSKYLQCGDFEEVIIEDLKAVIKQTNAEVIIIDNLTYLCNKSEKADAAGMFMLRLRDLHLTHKISSLIVSHTPKRGAHEPLDQCSMAGSMRLANFFQVMIGIGKSTVDEKIKYIKSVKYRASDICYGSDNVIMCQIVKPDKFPYFERLGTCEERTLLQEVTEKKNKDLIEQAKNLQSEGKTQREIAEVLKCSIGKVNKMLKA